MKPHRKHTRGYPVAVLLGLDEKDASIWELFSKSAKPMITINFNGIRGNLKDLYNFHECIVKNLRNPLRDGVRSIIVSSSPRSRYSQEFISHLDKHQTWLRQGENRIAITEMQGLAKSRDQVMQVLHSKTFQDLIRETTSKEADNLTDLMNKQLAVTNSENKVLFSLEEAEDMIFRMTEKSANLAEFLLVTDKYLDESRNKGRLNRLLQIASNKRVRTRVIDAESPAGQRLSQLGGIVCLVKSA